MPVIVQAYTLSRKLIEKARWEVEFPGGIQEGQEVAISLPTSDSGIIGYLSKSQSQECMLEKSKDGSNITMSCKVLSVRHMVDISLKAPPETSSMAIVIPMNKLVEYVLTYLVSPIQCDQKFVHAVSGGVRASSGSES